MSLTQEAFGSIQALPLFAIFAVAGISKLLNLGETSKILNSYRLASEHVGVYLAAALGIGEIVVAVAILALRPAAAGLLTLLVLVGFSVFIIVNLVRGRRLDCACFGRTLPSTLSWWTVARNAIIAIPALLLVTESSMTWLTTLRLAPPVPLLTIASVETCAIFLFAAALAMNSRVPPNGDLGEEASAHA